MIKNCEDCGTSMGEVHYSRRFCSDCTNVRRNAARVEATKKRREHAKEKKPVEQEPPKRTRPKPKRHCWDLTGKSATQVSVEAAALGLSYGQYSSLVSSPILDRRLADMGITNGLERIDRAWREHKNRRKRLAKLGVKK